MANIQPDVDKRRSDDSFDDDHVKQPGQVERDHDDGELRDDENMDITKVRDSERRDPHGRDDGMRRPADERENADL